MIIFFKNSDVVYATQVETKFSSQDIKKLEWLFGSAQQINSEKIEGLFIGPRREMITPWSTNAVEITQKMGIAGIIRIEEFIPVQSKEAAYDKMLNRMYEGIDQDVFSLNATPEPIVYITDLESYNVEQGLALSSEEIEYLNTLPEKLGRKLTDSEVFGFSQVNSEHCRHKIFNGQFIIDGKEMESSLFGLIKKTTKENPNSVVSAYKDNCAFLAGPTVEQFAPASQDKPDFYETNDFESVISIKAETHNFPTTVEPFNGAATGTGGEIRDRMAGGKGSFPVAGTAVYMTSYPRMEEGNAWETAQTERPWLYQTPQEILMKASNGASDFGNKFGQPLICGSLLTFEHAENNKKFGFDKVIMLAGGIGYGKKKDCLKAEPEVGDKVVLIGGDNYRIGMGGGAVSSVATGQYNNSIELNAIQRSNPEMQKRAYNTVRALSEDMNNPIISIHDHGAGGHLNCLSELIETTGGKIDLEKLPVGDPTLSSKEIVGNESQERIGFVIKEKDIEKVRNIAERECTPMYVIGETTGDMQFTFVNNFTGAKPIDMPLEYMFGKAPRTIMEDKTIKEQYADIIYSINGIEKDIENVLSLEAVACKDWLTNKVDRSVTGRIAQQQTTGSIQLPLNDCAVVALDYQGEKGIATALGHAPVAAMADAAKGSVLSIAESLTNIVFAPLEEGLKSISLSANWMWPCKNEGEDARLYSAVKAASDFALALNINIPTGKDSLSMTQKYKDDKVYSPGTVIITSAGAVSDVKKTVKASLINTPSDLIYIDFSCDSFGLGGSSFAQTKSAVGSDVPTVNNPEYFAKAFEQVQELIKNKKVFAGHDISAGGLITALLEMCFPSNSIGLTVYLNELGEKDLTKVLFSERPSIILQVANGNETKSLLEKNGVKAVVLGKVESSRKFELTLEDKTLNLDINHLRDVWYKKSYLFDILQSGEKLAKERYTNYKKQELNYLFPTSFTGKLSKYGLSSHRTSKSGIKAAVIREKGSNGEREMAWCLHLAGFDVKDVHMTDLISGRENLKDVNLIAFVGGFSNSDVLNSAKGWAGAFLYNPKAKEALDKFYARKDTLSLGICNGCQLLVELGLITPKDSNKPKMLHNESKKFESTFVGLKIAENNNSVMLGSLKGSTLGVCCAHGEGRFNLPMPEEHYNIPAKYAYAQYPACPNGSDYNAAAICSEDGRHLAMMPHPERSLRPWNWGYYPASRKEDEVTPWIEMFHNAFEWIKERK